MTTGTDGMHESDGRVVAIYLTSVPGASMREVASVRAVAGHGLEGDRFFASPTDRLPRTCEMTLIQAEALEALERDAGVCLEPHESRRNVLTRGIDLNALVGRTFWVGEVIARGIKLCEPCAHLEALTRPGVLRGLVHRGGLRAEILNDGEIRRGASVREQTP